MQNQEMNIKPGDTITIGLGSATAHCAIATTSAVFTVVSVTDKAVQLSSYVAAKRASYSMWVPKTALSQKKENALSRAYFEADGTDYDEFLRTSLDIKDWFLGRMNGYQRWLMGASSDTLITTA